MRTPVLSHIVLLFISSLVAVPAVNAQSGSTQVKKWVKALSVKNDPRNGRLLQVLDEITATDQETWCQTMDEIQSFGNKYLMIRARLLRHSLMGRGMTCSPATDNFESLQRGLQEAYEIENDGLQYEIHLRLGATYINQKQFGHASVHYHQLFDILQKNKREEFHLPATTFYDMSYCLYHAHDYRGCIKIGLTALFALPAARFQPDDTLTPHDQLQTWNTIGLAYHKIQKYDSAFQAFDQAVRLADQIKDEIWKSIIRGNIGDVYYTLGQIDSARVLLQEDYDKSVAYQVFDNAANSLQWLARIDLQEGKTHVALQKLHKALGMLLNGPKSNFLANTYYALSIGYTAAGNAERSNVFLQKYLHLHDSLEMEITKSNTDIVQMRMNNLNQIQTIKSLNREKRQIAITRNLTILIVLLAGSLGYMWISRMRMKMQLRQQEALEGKRIAEAAAQSAMEQLDTFRQHLLEKNAIIEKWQSANETMEGAEEHNKRLSELSHHLILSEDDWVRFKVLFDSVYPGFFLSLRNKVPDISQAEQRMAALSKLKLTAREAANLLGVSPNTVYTTRRRLRQRLGLSQDSDLDPYFSAFAG